VTTGTRLRTFAITITAILVLPGKAVWGQPAHRKLDKSLQQTVEAGCSGGSRREVIIRTTAGGRQSMRSSMPRSHGNKVTGEFSSIDAVAAEVDCRDLAAVAALSTVASISVNARMDPHAGGQKPFSTGSSSKREGSKKGGLTQQEAAGQLQGPMFQTLLAWKELRAASYLGGSTSIADLTLSSTVKAMLDMGLTGSASRIGIAVIDSGIEPGPEFEDRISAFYDFTDGDVRAAPPSDDFGHGSHVAGLVAGRYIGIAPGARLVGLKVLDGNGQGTTSDVLRAIEFAIANKAALNLHILNLSLGHPIYESAATDPLVQAVERAVREGLVVVVSAGNYGINKNTGQPGYAGIASPGNAPSALTVGATNIFNTVSRADDRVTPYSSRGPSWYDGFAKPDVVAPGDNLLSVAAVGSKLRKLQEARGNVGEYMRLSGTSMAAGVASGTVALLLEVNPKLTPNAMKAIVEYTAISVSTDAGTPADALTQGTGQINGGGAAALAAVIKGDAPMGQSWLRFASVPPVTHIGESNYIWAQSIIWGNHRASGLTLLSEQRPAWALDIVWGDGLYDDDNIVWGNNDDNIVWGNALDLDDNIVWGNNVVWGNALSDLLDDDNIVWGNLLDDNIVWGNNDDNIVWGNNVVWGNGLIGQSLDDDNIVWGNGIIWRLLDDDNIVWGNLFDDNIVWGNNDDNVVWGNSLVPSLVSGKEGPR
jgi:serine protease AprX